MKYMGQLDRLRDRNLSKKEKFVPKEEIEGFQYDTLKRVFLGYHIDAPSTETKRSPKSGISNEALRLNSLSCLATCPRSTHACNDVREIIVLL